MSQIQSVTHNPLGYLGNNNVKRDGVVTQFTDDEVSEYLKCMKDPVYFAKKYAKVISLDRGLVPFELWPYQEKMFEHFTANRFSIVLAPRQSGKSISSCVYLLWYVIFHPEKTVAILANKGSTAREMIARITLALENLPFFLQPGCRALNKGSLEFSNNSRIIAAATSGSSIRGLSISLLFLDEFAFVQDAGTFYTSTYPVITSGKSSRVIISSTPKGIGNMFHRLWEGAVQGANEYKPFRVNWWDVPGRDEEWKRQTIANTSELQFAQEFSCSFLGTGATLITADILLELKATAPIYHQNNVRVYEKPLEDHTYIMTVDVCKGRGQDYSTFTIVDVSEKPFRVVATFRDNVISPLLFPDIIFKYGKTYNNAWILIENNDSGQVVCNGLYYDLEYENVFIESAVKANSIGITMTKKIKRIGCSTLKDLIEQKKIVIHDLDTIAELSTFEAHGDSFEATEGNHDDMVMNLVLFAWFVSSDWFVNITDVNIKDMIYAEKAKMIEDEIVPFGIISRGEDADKPKYEIIGNDAWFSQSERNT